LVGTDALCVGGNCGKTLRFCQVSYGARIVLDDEVIRPGSVIQQLNQRQLCDLSHSLERIDLERLNENRRGSLVEAVGMKNLYYWLLEWESDSCKVAGMFNLRIDPDLATTRRTLPSGEI